MVGGRWPSVTKSPTLFRGTCGLLITRFARVAHYYYSNTLYSYENMGTYLSKALRIRRIGTPGRLADSGRSDEHFHEHSVTVR